MTRLVRGDLTSAKKRAWREIRRLIEDASDTTPATRTDVLLLLEAYDLIGAIRAGETPDAADYPLLTALVDVELDTGDTPGNQLQVARAVVRRARQEARGEIERQRIAERAKAAIRSATSVTQLREVRRRVGDALG